MRNPIHLVLAAAFALALAACGNSSPVAGASGTVRGLHVDCAAADGGDGSLARPWNSLEQANQAQLGPGDQLLLRRGTVCTGMLEPQGSGAPDQPIVIGAYGDGPLPRIEAQGLKPAALQLADLSHLIAQDLELTNQGDSSALHRGVVVIAQNSLVQDITVRRMFVHHVDSPVAFAGPNFSGGGIVLWKLGPLPARFDGVVIEDNRVEDVAREGIIMRWESMAPRPRATEPWPEASTGIVVRRNTVTRVTGDLIVVTGTDGAIVEDNVASVGNLSGRNFLDPVNRNCAAGIFAYFANNTLIQRNEVFGMRFGQSSTDGCDGTGFDVDYNQDGTIIQFNYSHDNEGGFILLCSDDQPRTADVRYNLSLNDGHTFSAAPCKAPNAIGSFDGLRLYNNTFVAPNPNTSGENIPLPMLYNAGTFEFSNNIIYASQPQPLPIACGDHCSNNLFFNIPTSGTNAVSADPLFEDPSHDEQGRIRGAAGFRLRPGSPAIGAGVRISGTAGTDYFDNPVPTDRPPAIGFHQPD